MNLFDALPFVGSWAVSLAEGSGGVPAQPVPPNNFLVTLMPLLALGIIFYVLILRPESKRRKEREATLSALKSKDKVVTIGGLFGTVINVDKDEVTLLVDPNKDIKLKFRRSAIESIALPAAEKVEKKQK